MNKWIYYASGLSRDAAEKGDMEQAKSYGKYALISNIIGTISGIVILIAYFTLKSHMEYD